VLGTTCDTHVLGKVSSVVKKLAIDQCTTISEWTESHETWIYKQHIITQADREKLEEWVDGLNRRFQHKAGDKITKELALVGIRDVSQHHLNMFVEAMLFGTISGSAHGKMVRNMLFGGGNASTAQAQFDAQELLPKAVIHWRVFCAKQPLNEATATECLASVEGGDMFTHHPDKAMLIQTFIQHVHRTK
jgi:hypothetical protein